MPPVRNGALRGLAVRPYTYFNRPTNRQRYNGSLWPDSVSSATDHGHASIDCHYRWAASTVSTDCVNGPHGRPGSEAAMSLTATMMRVHEPGASLVADRIAVEEPGPRSVRVQVTASGMCHADIG